MIENRINTSKFQFTPLREGRLESLELYELLVMFQFTPLREGRPTATVNFVMNIVSIHAPA